jgi:hypothetical protein
VFIFRNIAATLSTHNAHSASVVIPSQLGFEFDTHTIAFLIQLFLLSLFLQCLRARTVRIPGATAAG